jgi:pSer/pThr/pTyr-binding forkhead associated (FHA) protein
MYCTRCGAENPDEANFCARCGQRRQGERGPTGRLAPEQVAAPDPETVARATGVEPPEIEPGQAVLVVVRGPNEGARFLLDRDLVSCGRHPDSDIFLDDVTVSRRHASFYRSEGTYAVKDEGSLNGTYVNGGRVDAQQLATGDEVQIGRFKLVAFVAAAEPTQ